MKRKDRLYLEKKRESKKAFFFKVILERDKNTLILFIKDKKPLNMEKKQN